MKHLLIDFENIQPQNLDNLPTEDTHIWLFLGVLHKHLPIELVQSLLRFGERAHLIRLEKSGKNALDFYLSYYLGQITATDHNATIGIVSRDGGYDILVEHILANQHAQNIVRLVNVDEIQTTPPPILIEQNQNIARKPILPIFQAALTALRAPDAFRPTRLHNLQLNLRKHILRDLIAEQNETEQDNTIQIIINKLQKQGFIQIDEIRETLTYHLSDSDFLARIQIYVLNKRPNTFADFQAAVRERASELCLNINEGDIQAFARHLREQNLIRQNNGKIEYAPFPEPQKQPEKPQTVKYQPDETVWQQILATISPKKTNRPNKVKSLENMIKSLTKYSDKEVQQLFQYLQDQKHIQVNENKVIYLK